MDLFFPQECLLRIIFLEKGLRDFFFSISSSPPQIINGRPLTWELACLHMVPQLGWVPYTGTL